MHSYMLDLEWTGNRGSGTSGYRDYDRSHLIQNKGGLLLSSDPVFRGDPERFNPEELLLASISSCHMLWFLHLCADAGVVITSYKDQPRGIMEELPEGGRFREVILHPQMIMEGDFREDQITELHGQAHKKCFITNSVNFEVKIEWKREL